MPTYASVLEQQEQEARPRLQSLTVAAATSLATTVVRDQYTVVVPPALQYPLTTGTGVTSAFGPRGGRMHEGADIFPGQAPPSTRWQPAWSSVSTV